MDKELYETYVRILNKELVTAMGCTEPIAIAYAGSLARKTLGGMPNKILIEVSGNIIKNVKSVIVPHTHGNKGIETAACIGITGGDAAAELEVISHVKEEDIIAMTELMKSASIKVQPLESPYSLDIRLTVSNDEHEAMVHIAGTHTHIVEMTKDNETIVCRKALKQTIDEDYLTLTMHDIYTFAKEVEIDDVKELLDQMIACNTAIAQEGMHGDYGANIGKVIAIRKDLPSLLKAYAAAGSDARMNGCELPVVINSGSGNQGLTVSVPLIVYAEREHLDKEKLYRALVISNLTAIHLKTEIGRLSAFCGAVSAGAACGAGLAYLKDASEEVMNHTIVNALAITSGIICDGAKASCAAKIAVSVEAGILGYDMYMNGQQFYGGDGIISKGIENTIHNIGVLGSQGMASTDQEIIKIMCE